MLLCFFCLQFHRFGQSFLLNLFPKLFIKLFVCVCVCVYIFIYIYFVNVYFQDLDIFLNYYNYWSKYKGNIGSNLIAFIVSSQVLVTQSLTRYGNTLSVNISVKSQDSWSYQTHGNSIKPMWLMNPNIFVLCQILLIFLISMLIVIVFLSFSSNISLPFRFVSLSNVGIYCCFGK